MQAVQAVAFVSVEMRPAGQSAQKSTFAASVAPGTTYSPGAQARQADGMTSLASTLGAAAQAVHEAGESGALPLPATE